MDNRKPPLIAHVIFRLDVGGLENGLVNLINGLPVDRFRHAIICIDDFTEFRQRIRRDDVEIIAIRKKPGTDPAALWRLYRVFRRIKPDIVHTRNLAALDALLPAFLAGVRMRIHSEHGWDVNDLDANNKKLRLLRKLHSPLVNQFIAVSRDLADYLIRKVGISESRISQIYNGVDPILTISVSTVISSSLVLIVVRAACSCSPECVRQSSPALRGAQVRKCSAPERPQTFRRLVRTEPGCALRSRQWGPSTLLMRRERSEPRWSHLQRLQRRIKKWAHTRS